MANPTLSTKQLLELVPQQRPFRFIDNILEVDENHIIAEYTFRKDESFYEGHFPNDPITPGVILLESMCQAGVVALGIYLLALEVPVEEIGDYVTMFTDAETEFMKVVLPEEKVTIHAEKIYWRRKKIRSNIKMFNSAGELVTQTLASGIGVRHD